MNVKYYCKESKNAIIFLLYFSNSLHSSNQRHNKLWRSKSESSLSTASSADSNLHVCADINFGDINPAELQPSISEESGSMSGVDPRRRSWSPNDNTADELLGDSSTEASQASKSAISSPMYLDSPTAHYAEGGFDAEGSDLESDDEEWQEIKFVVPEVPMSPKRTADQFPPKGTVSQKILNIEGVTTGESNEEGVKGGQDQELQKAVEVEMIPGEAPGMFVIEGAITSETTEDDLATESTKELEKVEDAKNMAAGQEESATIVQDEDDEKRAEPGTTSALDRTRDSSDEGRKTPINVPLFLPLAEGGFTFAREADLESITSSIAVNIDDDDDYIKKAHLEDDVVEEDVEDLDVTPEVLPDDVEDVCDRLLSPEEKEAFFTPDESVPPAVLQDSSKSMEVEESKEGATSEGQSTEDVVPQSSQETVSMSEELHLDFEDSSPMELNTNNNSSTENSPREAVIPSNIAKDSVKTSLSPAERRNVSRLSGSDSLESPESDGYKTASSDTADTPIASPMTYAKDYPKGSVKSRALCYETQISGDSDAEQSSSLDKPKSESPLTAVQDSSVAAPESQSIPLTAGAVLRQRRGIEERLKSESESEGSPPSTRSSKFFDDSDKSDESKVESKTEFSPPPPLEPLHTKDKLFASPSLQALEKGIVKKLTKQLLSSETTSTKDDKEITTAETETSPSASSTNSTKSVDKNQDKTQSCVSKTLPDNDRDSGIKPNTTSLDKAPPLTCETSPLIKTSPIVAETPPELVSDEGSVQPGATEEEKDVTYSRFGDEKIPLEPGLVKRHTKDYEQMEKLKEEVEMMEKTSSPESVTTPTMEKTGLEATSATEPSKEVTISCY